MGRARKPLPDKKPCKHCQRTMERPAKSTGPDWERVNYCKREECQKAKRSVAGKAGGAAKAARFIPHHAEEVKELPPPVGAIRSEEHYDRVWDYNRMMGKSRLA